MRPQFGDATMLPHYVERGVFPTLKCKYQSAQNERAPDQASAHDTARLQAVQSRTRELGEITKLFLNAE